MVAAGTEKNTGPAFYGVKNTVRRWSRQHSRSVISRIRIIGIYALEEPVLVEALNGFAGENSDYVGCQNCVVEHEERKSYFGLGFLMALIQMPP